MNQVGKPGKGVDMLTKDQREWFDERSKKEFGEFGNRCYHGNTEFGGVPERKEFGEFKGGPEKKAFGEFGNRCYHSNTEFVVPESYFLDELYVKQLS
eukprot:sb/3479016/